MLVSSSKKSMHHIELHIDPGLKTLPAVELCGQLSLTAC